MIEGANRIVLRSGDLAFTAYETGQGPTVLLLHGFPDTPSTWRFLAPALAGAGYRAVAVTLRGYERSSQPADDDYSLAALSGDVIGWLDALGVREGHLIGHDWGSSIAHIAAARAPERVRSLIALAVPHPAGFAAALAGDFDQLARSWYVFFLQQPAADLAVAADDFALLEYLWRRWSPGWSPPPDSLAALRSAFSEPRVVRAALQYYRTAFDAGHVRFGETAALAARPVSVPTLGLTGALDACVAPEVFQRAASVAIYTAGLDVARIPDVGHFLHLESPELIAARTLAWLRAVG